MANVLARGFGRHLSPHQAGATPEHQREKPSLPFPPEGQAHARAGLAARWARPNLGRRPGLAMA